MNEIMSEYGAYLELSKFKEALEAISSASINKKEYDASNDITNAKITKKMILNALFSE